MMPTLIFSWATAGPAATPSKTASAASFDDCFMLFLRSAAAQPKPTPHQYAQGAAYSDDHRTRKLRRPLYEGTMQAVRQLLET
jgi:methionine salvage enolase-phosphatase E1